MIDTEKKEIFARVQSQLKDQGFSIAAMDENRPWGGFFVIDEQQAQQFSDAYFNGLKVEDLSISGKLSPKILIVAPQKRLSWQYHHRRAEIWKVVEGEVGVVRSDTDEEGPLQIHSKGEEVTLDQGERHRLIGLNGWGVLAEIWRHTQADHPSDEEDIVRVQDDFGR